MEDGKLEIRLEWNGQHYVKTRILDGNADLGTLHGQVEAHLLTVAQNIKDIIKPERDWIGHSLLNESTLRDALAEVARTGTPARTLCRGATVASSTNTIMQTRDMAWRMGLSLYLDSDLPDGAWHLSRREV